MKISASIFAGKEKPLESLAKELADCGLDLLHIDCEDDPSVFQQIPALRAASKLPIDLHLISPEPEKYFDQIREMEIEYATIQLETPGRKFKIPLRTNTTWGISIVSETPIETFAPFESSADFLLFMTTEPGKSGGQFNKDNFKKIRAFRKAFPGKGIHVDGGINDEISFILRTMGVDTIVSGSYLVNADSIPMALINMKFRDVKSHFCVEDFMMDLDEIPVIAASEATLPRVLQLIEEFRLGFCLLSNEDGSLKGMISNADIRRGMIRHINDLNDMDISAILNPNPKVVRGDRTVDELLRLVKSLNFPAMFLPVIDKDSKLTGAITFNNLVKGEL